MIREIMMENIKGTSERQTLTGRDIIIGPNGAGKTTRMQALGLATLGYVPGKGKTAADTFNLSSDNTMVVGLSTEEFELQRVFKKSSKMDKNGNTDVKISQGIVVSPSKGESTNTQKEQRIKTEVGDFPAMLDFQSFLAMTDNKKRDFIYNLNSAEVKWDRERVEQTLKNRVIREEMSEEMADVMLQDFKETMNQYKASADVQDGLLAMKEYAKDRLSYWKKEKINAEGAARKLTELKNRGDETDRDLAINQEELKELQKERDGYIKTIAAATEKNKLLETYSKQLETIHSEIENMQNTQTKDRIEELQDWIHILETSLTIRPDLETEESEIKEIKQKAIDEKHGLEEADKVNKLGIAVEKQKIETYSEIIEKIEANKGHCAFSADIVCGQDFSEYIQQTQVIIDEAYAEIDKLNDSNKKHIEAIADCDQRIKEANARLDGLAARAKKISDKRMEDLQNLQKAKEEVSKLQSLAPTITAKKEKYREIQAYIENNPVVDLSIEEEQKNAVEAKIEAITAKIDEQKKIRNDLKNIKANIIDSKTANYHTECWKQIVDAIGQGGIQGEIVKELLDPLRVEIDSKLKSIGLNGKFFFETENDRGREIFSFGWADEKSKRPFESLSQGEQLLLLIALMTTIIERNNPPIKVLALDNINDLDSANLSRVLKGLMTAGAAMDNIILAGVVEPKAEDTNGWTVWNLGN